MKYFLNGVIFTLAFIFGAAVVAVYAGIMPAGADSKPFPGEKWAAGKSLHATLVRESKGVTNPLQATDDNLLAGIKSYGQNCSICHGASDKKASTLAKGFYIEAPLLAKDGVEDDPDGVTFWKLKHGIRFSAMPAFGANLSDDKLWELALFLKHMDKLSPAADAAWKKLPSVGP